MGDPYASEAATNLAAFSSDFEFSSVSFECTCTESITAQADHRPVQAYPDWFYTAIDAEVQSAIEYGPATTNVYTRPLPLPGSLSAYVGLNIGPITTAPITSTTTTSTISTSSSVTPTPTPTPAHHHGVSGSVIGPAVGVPVGVLLIAAMIFFFWRRSRKQKRQQAAAATDAAAASAATDTKPVVAEISQQPAAPQYYDAEKGGAQQYRVSQAWGQPPSDAGYQQEYAHPQQYPQTWPTHGAPVYISPPTSPPPPSNHQSYTMSSVGTDQHLAPAPIELESPPAQVETAPVELGGGKTEEKRG